VLYLSVIGFFTALLTCFGEGLEQAGSRLRGRLRFQKAIAAGAIVLVTFPFAAVSWHRLDVWRNEVTLWEDTVLKSPGLPNPQLYLALAYLRRGRLQEAERWYVSAAQLQPTPEAFSRIRYVRELIRMQQSP
jgi:tetratricopeptide (TPR) repeat protein